MVDMVVTSALPYANGQIHLGHLLEVIQADIWVRFHRSLGKRCLYLCGDDQHGTSIMLAAKRRNISPNAFVAEIYQQHFADFTDFNISFDRYHQTHSDENKQLSIDLYQRLKQEGCIKERDVEQAYDPKEEMFLADRFIRGTCPKCAAEEQYGDHCEQCGATYLVSELLSPRSVLSDAEPVSKTSKHLFFSLSQHEDVLKAWVAGSDLQEPARNKLSEWFDNGLQDWDISRDAPYFGFEIPGAPGKYFYVWLDAPIGYMACLQKLASDDSDVDFSAVWGKGSDIPLYHFIGKDILNFHGLYWPAMLSLAGYRVPTGLHVHGFLTVDGNKMSKSKGTFITARKYLEHFSPEYLRYYFATKLNAGVADLDLNWADFAQRVNTDLVGKIVNIGSRCARILEKNFSGVLADSLHKTDIYDLFVKEGDVISQAYLDKQYQQVVRLVIGLADQANQYIDQQAPWKLIKQLDRAVEVQRICTTGINLFRALMIYLMPILPESAAHTARFFAESDYLWVSVKAPLLEKTLPAFPRLMERIQPEKLAAFSSEMISGAT